MSALLRWDPFGAKLDGSGSSCHALTEVNRLRTVAAAGLNRALLMTVIGALPTFFWCCGLLQDVEKGRGDGRESQDRRLAPEREFRGDKATFDKVGAGAASSPQARMVHGHWIAAISARNPTCPKNCWILCLQQVWLYRNCGLQGTMAHGEREHLLGEESEESHEKWAARKERVGGVLESRVAHALVLLLVRSPAPRSTSRN